MPATRTSHGPALFAKGFRPFFLLAGVFAVALLPMWLAALFAGYDPGAYFGAMYWHAHEMVFGYSVAVIAGFLLTAVGNWTQRETAVGAPLLALSALWLAGRFAVLGATHLPHGLAAAVDLAFIPALAVALGRPLVAAKNRRNYIMLAALAVLWATNLATHLDALGVLPGWRRRGALLAVDAVVFVILAMAGRVFPMFTRNATGVQTIRNIPALDKATLVAAALLCAAEGAMPDSKVAAVLAGVTGLAAAARAIHWGAQHTRKVPLLWILHAGYAWTCLGLVLRAVSAFTPAVPSPVATHALTVGSIGGLTLGMMARVSLGHTGRPLTTSRAVTASFVCVTAAALVRVGAPLVSASLYRPSLMVAGVLWSLAFALYVAVYAPILAAPRADGKPG